MAIRECSLRKETNRLWLPGKGRPGSPGRAERRGGQGRERQSRQREHKEGAHLQHEDDAGPVRHTAAVDEGQEHREEDPQEKPRDEEAIQPGLAE